MSTPTHLSHAALAALLIEQLAPLQISLYRPDKPEASIHFEPGEGDTRYAGWCCVAVLVNLPPPAPIPLEQIRVLTRDEPAGVAVAAERVRDACANYLRSCAKRGRR